MGKLLNYDYSVLENNNHAILGKYYTHCTAYFMTSVFDRIGNRRINQFVVPLESAPA